jgi:hypothetical protein
MQRKALYKRNVPLVVPGWTIGFLQGIRKDLAFDSVNPMDIHVRKVIDKLSGTVEFAGRTLIFQFVPGHSFRNRN